VQPEIDCSSESGSSSEGGGEEEPDHEGISLEMYEWARESQGEHNRINEMLLPFFQDV
jgi:hypothetical protein